MDASALAVVYILLAHIPAPWLVWLIFSGFMFNVFWIILAIKLMVERK